tara:strand:- start:1534 stop:1926 length:393 start_codon:yes stop_codon:yes gene_type:complete
MATLTPTLTLTSSDVSSDTLSLSVTDSLTVEAPIINVSTITATTTGNASIILPSVNAARYVYLKHTGLNSAGSSSGADKVEVETADGTAIMELKSGEFAFFPYFAQGAGLLQLEASANTVQVEYAYFTRS